MDEPEQKTVLVVSEEHIYAVVFSTILKSGGFLAPTANSIQETYEMLDQGQVPDAILLNHPGDITMLVSFCSSLRTRRDTSQTPIILLDLPGRNEDYLKQVKEAGVNEILFMPFTPALILNTVKSLIDG